MKKIFGLFVMFFVLTTCFAVPLTPVQRSLDKQVFLSGVETPTANFVIIASTFQTEEFGLVKCPVVQENYIDTNTIVIQNYKSTILNKTAEVQNKDVVWLTNMKSK